MSALIRARKGGLAILARQANTLEELESVQKRAYMWLFDEDRAYVLRAIEARLSELAKTT